MTARNGSDSMKPKLAKFESNFWGGMESHLFKVQPLSEGRIFRNCLTMGPEICTYLLVMKSSLLVNVFIFEFMRRCIQLCLQNAEFTWLKKAVGFYRPQIS
jgi:hypothetical protein